MLASRSSRWVAGTLALCVLLLVGFWFLLVGPRQAEAADLNDQRVQADAGNDQLKLQIEDLKAQAAALPQRQAQLAEIKREFPPQVLLATLIRDLDTMAAQSGVTIASMSPGTPVAVGASTGAAASGSGTTAQQAAGAGANGLLQVPVTIRVEGDYFQVATFTKRVQQMTRATLISGITMTESQNADSDPGDVSATFTGAFFVLPDSAEGAAAATGAGSPAAPAAGSGGTQ